MNTITELNRTISMLMAHPDNEPNSEFADRIDSLIDLKEQLRLHGVSTRFSSAEKMAEWLHNNYEEIALNNGWKTQDDCQVPFLDLPKENKQTMIEVCKRFLNVC